MLAESLSKLWPDSAAALTVAGYASHYENKPEQAIDNCLRALAKEPAYWTAAYQCGALNFDRQNWQVALDCYKTALESESGREIPDIYFEAAWCAGKKQSFSDEERYLRACLDLDPDFPFARNNLGWALYRQHRFEEALKMFDECIEQKVDGAYPLRNRARTLMKLGRLSEAIDAWKLTGRRGKLTKHAQEQIAKLQARINRGEEGKRTIGEEEDARDEGSYQPREK